MGEEKNKTLSKQQEGQEKYLIQTMNIVISSHSLHSQSSCTGRAREPRNAKLPGMGVCVAGRRGASTRGGSIAIPGRPQPPMNCRLVEESEDRDRGKWRLTVRAGPRQSTPGCSSKCLSSPFCGLLVSHLCSTQPISSCFCLLCLPELCELLSRARRAGSPPRVGCDPGTPAGGEPREEGLCEWPPAMVTWARQVLPAQHSGCSGLNFCSQFHSSESSNLVL